MKLEKAKSCQVTFFQWLVSLVFYLLGERDPIDPSGKAAF